MSECREAQTYQSARMKVGRVLSDDLRNTWPDGAMTSFLLWFTFPETSFRNREPCMTLTRAYGWRMSIAVEADHFRIAR